MKHNKALNYDVGHFILIRRLHSPSLNSKDQNWIKFLYIYICYGSILSLVSIFFKLVHKFETSLRILAQLVEHRTSVQKVVSLTLAGPTLRVLE